MPPGSTFGALMNGRKRTLTVTGIVLSPEYIYALGPGDMVPDPRRFGVLFMPRSALAGLFDMDGAFNDVALRTQRGASEPRGDRCDSTPSSSLMAAPAPTAATTRSRTPSSTTN